MTFQPSNERISMINTDAVLSPNANQDGYLLHLTDNQYDYLCCLLRQSIEQAKEKRIDAADEDEYDNLTYNIDIEEVILINLRSLKPPLEQNDNWDDLPF